MVDVSALSPCRVRWHMSIVTDKERDVSAEKPEFVPVDWWEGDPERDAQRSPKGILSPMGSSLVVRDGYSGACRLPMPRSVLTLLPKNGQSWQGPNPGHGVVLLIPQHLAAGMARGRRAAATRGVP